VPVTPRSQPHFFPPTLSRCEAGLGWAAGTALPHAVPTAAPRTPGPAQPPARAGVGPYPCVQEAQGQKAYNSPEEFENRGIA